MYAFNYRIGFKAIGYSALLIAFCSYSYAAEPEPDTDASTTETEAQTTDTTSTSVLDAYPKADADSTRHVIHLPIGDDENNLKIELLAGKVAEVDCNLHQYSGNWEEKIVEGWGYNYYELSQVEGPLSTKKACPDEEPSLQFVPVVGNASLLQYNSSLPVVVYLPKDFELRWRTWVATPYITATEE